MRFVAVLTGLSGPAAAAASTVPLWAYLAAALLTNAGLYALINWRIDRKVKAAEVRKSDADTELAAAERDDLTAEIYRKLRADVADHLEAMETRLAEENAARTDAQAKLAEAQAELAKALTRAADDRRELHRQLQEAEERAQNAVDEYREEIARVMAQHSREVAELRRRIAELETALAAAGHTERRHTGRRRTDPPS